MKLRKTLLAKPLVRAFGVSVLLHFIAFFVIETGYFTGMWKTRAVPKWALNNSAKPIDPKTQRNDSEPVVLQFIEIDPSQVAVEEPKDAKLYSTANTTAANPDT